MPKTMNCRLGEEDKDIQEDLAKTSDKTARIKELYRLGMLLEVMKKDTNLVPDKDTALMYRVWVEELLVEKGTPSKSDEVTVTPAPASPLIYTS